MENLTDKLGRAVTEIKNVLSSWRGPIVIAYSGGKDSSAVIKLLFYALAELNERPSLQIVYCDTGVENPVLSTFVFKTLAGLTDEIAKAGFSDSIHILAPEIHRRYFVRIIGRGYPPPTQFFRWCTKDLRIRPVQAHIKNLGEDALVVVGTRAGESAQRDRALGDESTRIRPYIRPQIDGALKTHLYSPIIDFDLTDVWESLTEISFPTSIDIEKLVSIYRGGGGECPTIRETNDKPCASARFGCWTCTVVRRDRSAENMIESGYEFLRPYHRFRSWLLEMRNNPSMRCKRRRSGAFGLGPFTLDARMLILEKLFELERAVDLKILSNDERCEIDRLWELDRNSIRYREMEWAGQY